mmetsp:Transcript_131838/g.196486  ORF Transcript_131838/g.196486 Transcript_131838/m.196486 type:complete len:80 (-) Transcript_131838:467-706(-)
MSAGGAAPLALTAGEGASIASITLAVLGSPLVSGASKAFNKTLKYAKPVVHYGFVPLVLYLGFQTAETQPTLIQLVLPI